MTSKNAVAPTTMTKWRSVAQNKVMNADETVKRRLRLSGRTAADFAVTSAGLAPCRNGDEPTRGVTANSVAWASGGVPGNPDGSYGLERMLGAMKTLGVRGGETTRLLQGLAAILHLWQVRR